MERERKGAHSEDQLVGVGLWGHGIGVDASHLCSSLMTVSVVMATQYLIPVYLERLVNRCKYTALT